MNEITRPVDTIRVGNRHRKLMHNIEQLAQSIADIGLLHPIVITPDGELIAGQRRLAAVKMLGLADVPVTVIDLDDPLLGEYAENVQREDFTPTEAVDIGRAIEEREREKAAQRMEHADNTYGKLPQVLSGATRDKVGDVVGMSGKSYEKAKKVVEAAENDPETFGDLPDMMDAKSIDKAFKELSKRNTAVERKELADTAESIPPDDRWHIEVGDIRTYQTTPRFDFIITDPPYPREYLDLYGVLADRAAEWLKPGGLLLAMCGESYLDEIMALMNEHLEYYWMGCYLTPGQPTPLRTKQVNTTWKPILIYQRSGDKYTGKIFGDVWTSDGNDKSHHKWGQSVSGMYSMIKQVCLPGQSIFDPFCGAGTTGIAALKHGCLFHGIDLEQANVDLSIARIAEAMK